MAVIVSHAWPIGGFGSQPQLGRLTLGGFAVAGFFTISGWLIMQSRLSSELPSYLWRRLLRIYPAFLVALLAVAFGFAPLGSALGAGPYSAGDGVRHVADNFTLVMQDYSVGGTPTDVPFPGAWNGSLWTLFHEALCYVAVGVIVTVVGRRWAAPAIVASWLALTALAVGVEIAGRAVPGTLQVFLGLAPYFFAGAALYMLRSRIPLHPAVAVAGAVIAAGILATGAPPILAALPVAYVLLWLGAALPFHTVGRRNDISYGMYIYAFPVQQTLMLLGLDAGGPWLFIVASVVCTAPLAALSWFLIERPAMGLRRAADRFPLVRSGLLVGRRPGAGSAR